MSTESTAPADWASRFLAALSATGIVLDACQAAGISRAMAYKRRKNDPVFEQDWQYALQDAADVMLRVYRERGFAQSDRAMEFFIRSRDPDSFTSERTLTIQINWPLVPDTLLDAFLAGRIPLEELHPYAVRNLN